MSHDPNSARQVRDAEKREKLQLDQAADDVRAVMVTEQGRRFVNGLLGICDIRADGYVPGGPEAQRHQDYMAGRRSIGIEVLGQIEQHAPLMTELMTTEARAAAAEKQLANELAAQEQDDG
jgi:hypothetical protein